MRLLALGVLVACDRPEQDIPKWEPTTTDPPAVDLPSVWDELVACREPADVVLLPEPVPAVCDPAAPGWVSGPVAGWAQAKVVGPFAEDLFGQTLTTIDLDGDGRDGLVIGAPHLGLPDTTYYRQPQPSTPAPRTYLVDDLSGEAPPSGDGEIAAEGNVAEESIGQSAAALTRGGPILLGDYMSTEDPGHVKVIAGTAARLETTIVAADDSDHCGADVGVADVDGSGTPDIVTACLQSPLSERGTVGGFRQEGGVWEPFFRMVGTVPYSWFGRPSVGGFDLDGDRVADLVIGEGHIGQNLESASHLISGAWEGDCTLRDVGSRTVWNGFYPARYATGDIDGDGVGELVVTSQGSPVTSFVPVGLPGRVAVLRDLSAGDGPLEDAAWLNFVGVDSEEAFGASAAVGDFNADGCADVAIGATGHNYTTDLAPGRVYVFHGPFTGGVVTAADAEVVLEGSFDDDRFGWPLAVGDFDGNGIDDLAVSAQYDPTSGDQAGAVYVLPGVAGVR